MRIVHALNGMPTGSFYGVEAHVLTLAAAQKARGHSIMAITDRPSFFTESCERAGIQVAIDPDLRPGRKFPGQVAEQTVENLASRFKAFCAHMIHCHTPFAAWPAISAGNRSGIPCSFTLHAEGFAFLERSKHLRYSVIVVCRAHLESAKQVIARDRGPYLIPNGTKAMPAQSTEVCGPGRSNLIMVGHLSPNKGTDIAILAMAALRRKLGQDCPVLNIYGDGPPWWSKYVKEIVETLDLSPNVSFHGSQPGILRICPASDILIVSSRSETGPIVVLEAMSRGMPIVTTEVGEVTEMLPDERYGRIVPVNSIVALSAAVESALLDISHRRFDPNLVIGRHRSHFSDAVMAERLDEAYKRILETESVAG